MFLKVDGIHTYYGTSHILFGVGLQIEEGKAVAILGRNGAGKTTTLRSIIGLTPPRQGKVFFLGKDITGEHVHLIAQMGIGYVPENRMIFPDLTVLENLSLAINPKRPGKFTVDTAFEIFPRLADMRNRPGGFMSGGEQQMLAIARSLMINPRLLMLDEPLEGLSPLVVRELGIRIKELKEKQGLTILLSEQNVGFAMDLCNSVYIINKGNIEFEGSIEEFQSNKDLWEKHLTVHGGAKRDRNRVQPDAIPGGDNRREA
jgi:branched-chain amino acid transport system ATP-binding protein